MKLNILFLLYKSKTNAKGKCPIRCRITHNKKRKEFSTGLFVTPNKWNSRQQEVKPPDINSINAQLSLIKTQINQAFLLLQVNQIDFNVDDIFRQYKGENVRADVGVLEAYNLFLKYLKKLIDKELNEDTYNKYVAYGRHLKSFIKSLFPHVIFEFSHLQFSVNLTFPFLTYLTSQGKAYICLV